MTGACAPDQALKLPSGSQAEFDGINRLAKLDKKLSKYLPDFISTMRGVHDQLKKNPCVIKVPDRVKSEIPFDELIMTDFHLQLIVQQKIGDDLILSELQKRNVPGASVAVIHNQKVVIQKSFGLADVKKLTPVTNGTSFMIGSVTKQFTATAILLLHAENKLKIDDPVIKYIPELPSYAKSITIRNLLTHTSGLPRDFKKKSVEPFSNELIKGAELIKELMKSRLDFKPNERAAYSNTGYVLLGMIIEKISGMTHEQFLKRRIFDPIKMNSTFCLSQSISLTDNLAIGYVKNGDDYIPIAPALRYGAGSIITTLEDMIKWNEAIENNKLLSKNFQDLMWKKSKLDDGSIATLGRDQEGWHFELGFGWFLYD